MNARGNAFVFESLLKGFAVRDAHHKQMPHGHCMLVNHRRAQLAVTAQRLLIKIRVPAAAFVPFIQVAQLNAQNSRLQSIQPTVVTFDLVCVFLEPAVIRQHTNALD